jgi:hypothetical protein
MTITLALIATAAAIALICDFLRARNAQLRHAMAELEACNRARKQAANDAKDAANRPAAAQQMTRKKTLTGSSRTQLGAGNAQPLQRLNKNKEDRMTSRQALSDWLIERAAARDAQKTAAETRASEPGKSEPVPGRLPAPDRVLKPFAVPARPVPVSIDAYLWESLTAAEPETGPTPRFGTRFELIQGSGGSGKLDLDVPAGMHAAIALEQLTGSRKLFTGLVISIGVNQGDIGRNRDENLMQSLESFVSDLLRETDFGCRVNGEEFLIICPGPHGAEAQRRLSQVSERLWDFQLRTLGKLSILFSVGGIDVQRESLSDAIALAKERMGQTRRSRNAVPSSVAPQYRKAV